MSTKQANSTIREVVGIFSRYEELQSAIDELLSSGFHRAELSLLASEDAVVEKLGYQYTKVSELSDNSHVPRAAYVSTEALGDAKGAVIGALMYVGATAAAGAILVSGGTIAAGIAAIALAGGARSLIGAILARWVGNKHAQYLYKSRWITDDYYCGSVRGMTTKKRAPSRFVHLHALPVAA